MREIKFRAWDNISEEMYFVDSLGWDYKTEKLEYINIMNEGENISISEDEIENIILMQYTDIDDKNGVEIAEGDILYWEDLSETSDDSLNDTVKVYWNNEFMKWCVTGINWSDKSQIEPLYDYSDVDEIEVIGNIWEDGDLLNDSE